MNNALKILSAILLLNCMGCRFNITSRNDFEIKYYECLSAVKSYNQDASRLNYDSLCYVLSYLSYFSGHKTQMHIGDVNVYLKESQFDEDLSIWDEWIKMNGDKYSLASADSLFVNYGKSDKLKR